MPRSKKSSVQGLSETAVFLDGVVYSRAAEFHEHLLGLTVVDVARDHGAEGGHLWAMEEGGEINRSQKALS